MKNEKLQELQILNKRIEELEDQLLDQQDAAAEPNEKDRLLLA